MRITDVEGIPLSTGSLNPHDCDGQDDDFVVRIHTDTGLTGAGEADTPPEVSAALIDSPSQHIWALNLRELLLGEDPLETERLWEKMYDGTIYVTRRGLGLCVMSAIDIALHDVAAKGLSVPVYKLLGGAKRSQVYAVLQRAARPAARTFLEPRTGAGLHGS